MCGRKCWTSSVLLCFLLKPNHISKCMFVWYHHLLSTWFQLFKPSLARPPASLQTAIPIQQKTSIYEYLFSIYVAMFRFFQTRNPISKTSSTKPKAITDVVVEVAFTRIIWYQVGQKRACVSSAILLRIYLYKCSRYAVFCSICLYSKSKCLCLEILLCDVMCCAPEVLFDKEDNRWQQDITWAIWDDIFHSNEYDWYNYRITIKSCCSETNHSTN